MDSSLEVEQEPSSKDTHAPAEQLHCTSTPFVRPAVDIPTDTINQQTSFVNQDASFAKLEASSIAEVSRFSSNSVESELASAMATGDVNTSMNSSMTALNGSFTEETELELLSNIKTPELSNNPLNKAFCSDSSVVLKSQQQEEEECSSTSDTNDAQTTPQSSIYTDNVTPAEVQKVEIAEADCPSELIPPPTAAPESDTKPQSSIPDKNIEPQVETQEASGVHSEQIPLESGPTATEDEECMDVAVSNSEQPSEKTSTAVAAHNSIYLSDDDETSKQPPHPPAPAPSNQPTKRLTMAQKAAMEALASFGGSDLASVSMKKRDLRSELKRDAERMKGGDSGEGKTDNDGVEPPPAKRPRTRLQKAQQEVLSTFKNIPLGERPARSRRGRYKRGAVTQRTSAKSRTRLQRAKDEALAAFGGESLDSLSKKKDNGPTADEPAPPQPGRRMTRVERARLEALQSFGGSGFGDVMGGTKKIVARTLEEKKVPSEGVEGDGVKSDGVEGEGVKSDGVEEEGVKGDGVESEGMTSSEGKENKDDTAVNVM